MAAAAPAVAAPPTQAPFIQEGTGIPEWLSVMRAITGLTETPGTADNPKIMAMADTIAEVYPEMTEYCAGYTHDSIAWCGLTVAYCMTKSGVRPVFGPTDIERFLWAQAWDDPSFGTILTKPILGCIVVGKREGGGHVTMYESTSGSNYMCRGGNQSDAVNLAPFPIANVIALVWPKAAAGVLPPQPRPQLAKGSTGTAVAGLQKSLGLLPDGDFGSITEAQVKSFQAAAKLIADGIVGDQTWAAVDDLDRRKLAGDTLLPDAVMAAINDLVGKSPLVNYSWEDRGRAPRAYLNGMAMVYGVAVLEFDAESPHAIEMAQKERTDDQTDALTWYKSKFAAKGMNNTISGLDTLRHLFVMMIGLGMRESSGKYYEGRDTTATNMTADTCEAGLFQTSWNIKSCSANIPPLLEKYWNDPNGFLSTFQQGLAPTAAGLGSYGSGDGARYQFLAKYAPLFHAFVTGVGMRKLRKHWGPINRSEVEINEDADDLLMRVEELVETAMPLPEPEPPPEPPPVTEVAKVAIVTTGKVIITVNGDMVYGPPAQA